MQKRAINFLIVEHSAFQRKGAAFQTCSSSVVHRVYHLGENPSVGSYFRDNLNPLSQRMQTSFASRNMAFVSRKQVKVTTSDTINGLVSLGQEYNRESPKTIPKRIATESLQDSSLLEVDVGFLLNLVKWCYHLRREIREAKLLRFQAMIENWNLAF